MKKQKTFGELLSAEYELIISKIKGLNNQQIKLLKKQNNCKHKWDSWASGFFCKKCDYYTDVDSKINGWIDKFLNK